MLFTRLNRTQLICKICLRSLLAITACATFFTAIAQCPPNGITTNPDNTDWSAPIYNALYKKNTGTNLFDLAFVGVARKQRAGLTNKRINLNYWIAKGGKKYGLKRR